ncbi:RIP metalloprotease RseP [Chondrinema litorale]|uniref:RIP metalloprotease RseP n=1 Tax=Chondrinema litorale TaxID=2994555 RepID=UPI002542932C|nr:RIP metalloprotease RseP [Chondrinema litorale]UZR95652.1 RIP metalloprotease RseP [Chondrinema litorale]
MEGLIMTAQLLLGLSILVGLHELGHLIAAKVFGMRVEKYSIGFPPKLFGVKIGETEYSLGALPLGGFVKISGMIDESLDTAQLKTEPKPWEFRAKPAWQRLIVMLGGIIVNVITGIVIFIFLVYLFGDRYYSIKEVNKYGIYVNELGEEIGLKTGDKILKINGHDFEYFNDVRNPNFLLESGSYYTIDRDGKTIDVSIPADFIERLSDNENNRDFVHWREPFVVDSVLDNSAADRGGLRSGDKILSVDNQNIEYFHEFSDILSQKANSTVNMVVKGSNGEERNLEVDVTEDGTVGFYPKSMLEPSIRQYSFAEAIPKGTVDAFSVITVQLKAFNKIFKGEVSATKSLSGPIGIAKFFGGTWDWVKFWTITGMLSMVLAFMNLLPIPALDGGHVVFLTYEIISGRPPSDSFLEASQKVGMVLLLCLMVFAFGNDIYKLFQP